MCRKVAQSSRENFEHVQKILCDKIPCQMVAKSSRLSRTRRELVADPSQFSRNHFGTGHICEINKTELRTNCDINETLRDNIASKLN